MAIDDSEAGWNDRAKRWDKVGAIGCIYCVQTIVRGARAHLIDRPNRANLPASCHRSLRVPTSSDYVTNAAHGVTDYVQRTGIGLEVELVSLALALTAAGAAWLRWGRPRWHGVKRAVSGLLDLGRDAPAVLASVERSSRVAESLQSIQHSTALLIGKMRAQADADHSLARIEGAADGRIEWTSSALSRWTGRTPFELLGHGWISTVHPEDREAVADEWTRCIRFARAFDAAFRLRDDDGGTVWVRMTASPVPVPDLPAVACWVGAIRQTGAPPASPGLALPERAT